MPKGNRYFYCPECEDNGYDIFDYKQLRIAKTGVSMRGGWGRPITFYKCPKCENVLAGSMDFRGWNENQEHYAKIIISGYNVGGIYYDKEFHDYCKNVSKNKN